MPNPLEAHIDEVLLGSGSRAVWRKLVEEGLAAFLDAPVSSLVAPEALADFIELFSERVFLTQTAGPAALALARLGLSEAQRDDRPLASYLSVETRQEILAHALSARPVPRALLDALFAEKGIRAFIEGFLLDALREFYERANPFFAETGLPAMIKKLMPIGSGVVIKALEAGRGEFEKRLEPELRRFLGGFTGRALESIKSGGVGAGSREVVEGLATTVVSFVLNRPVKELAGEVRVERTDGVVRLIVAILSDLDDDETLRSRRRELVTGYVKAQGDLSVREILAQHGMAVAPNLDALAEATYPFIRGVLQLSPVRAWFDAFAESARNQP